MFAGISSILTGFYDESLELFINNCNGDLIQYNGFELAWHCCLLKYARIIFTRHSRGHYRWCARIYEHCYDDLSGHLWYPSGFNRFLCNVGVYTFYRYQLLLVEIILLRQPIQSSWITIVFNFSIIIFHDLQQFVLMDFLLTLTGVLIGLLPVLYSYSKFNNY